VSMSEAAERIDEMMERASQSRVERDYLACERLSVEALRLAREAGDFERLARITLPLQEARRQRRQIAEDAGAVVFTGERLTPEAVLDQVKRGCVLLTDPPYSEDDAQAVRALARERGAFVEVVRLDSAGLTAMVCRAMEDVGDAALASIPAQAGPVERIDRIMAELDRIGDHEIAHQRLAEAARAAAGG